MPQISKEAAVNPQDQPQERRGRIPFFSIPELRFPRWDLKTVLISSAVPFGMAALYLVAQLSGGEPENKVQAAGLSFPESAPKVTLAGKVISSYVVDDLLVFGGNKIAMLATENDGQYIVCCDINDLRNKAKLPFSGKTVFASDDGTILGALGSQAPGVGSGRLGLLEGNKSLQVFNNGQGEIWDGTVTSDKLGVPVRAQNGVGPGFLYQYFDLTTKIFRPLTICLNCVPGNVGFPLVPSVASINSSYGSAFPVAGGYTENSFDFATMTVKTKLWHPEQGFTSKRLVQYDLGNQHIIQTTNNDTNDPSGTYTWATLMYNIDNVHIASKDVRPNIPLYPEYQAGQGIGGIGISTAVADIVGGYEYMLTTYNPMVGVVYYPHIERFPLANPGDLSQRLLVPESGDLPASYPNLGSEGAMGRFLYLLNSGTDRDLLNDVVVEKLGYNGQSVYNGLYRLRVTNGITPSEQWHKVTINGGYQLWLPVVME